MHVPIYMYIRHHGVLTLTSGGLELTASCRISNNLQHHGVLSISLTVIISSSHWNYYMYLICKAINVFPANFGFFRKYYCSTRLPEVWENNPCEKMSWLLILHLITRKWIESNSVLSRLKSIQHIIDGDLRHQKSIPFHSVTLPQWSRSMMHSNGNQIYLCNGFANKK